MTSTPRSARRPTVALTWVLIAMALQVNQPAEASEQKIANPSKNGNSALEYLSSWIGDEWRISTVWNDGKPFRARGVWAWGPGKRFVMTRTFVVTDSGQESLLCENVFAVDQDHLVNYAFSNDGSVQTALVRLSDGGLDSLWTSENTTMRQQIRIMEPDRISWKISTQRSDGQWQQLVGGDWFRSR